MYTGGSGLHWLAALTSVVLSACYIGGQRASQVAITPALDADDNMPASDLSLAADYYEMTGGLIFGKFELFSGAGLTGIPRVHQRTGQSASASDDLPFVRAHAGAAWEALVVNGFALRAFGVLGADLTSQLFEDTSDGDPEAVDSVITSSRELGLQISTVANRGDRESTYLEPVIRIAYASQSGKARGGALSEGFTARALIVTLGVNLGLGGGF